MINQFFFSQSFSTQKNDKMLASSEQARKRFLKHQAKIQKQQGFQTLPLPEQARVVFEENRRKVLKKMQQQEKKRLIEFNKKEKGDRYDRYLKRQIKSRKELPALLERFKTSKSIDDIENLQESIKSNIAFDKDKKLDLLKNLSLRQKLQYFKQQRENQKLLLISDRNTKQLIKANIAENNAKINKIQEDIQKYSKSISLLKGEKALKKKLFEQQIKQLGLKYENNIIKHAGVRQAPEKTLLSDRFAGQYREQFKTFGIQTLKQFYQDIRSVQNIHDANVILYYEEGGEKRDFTVTQNYMINYEAFKNRLGAKFDQKAAQQYGSDSISDGFRLQTQFFTIAYGTLFGEKGDCKSVFYNCVKQEESDTTPCFIYALQKLSLQMKNGSKLQEYIKSINIEDYKQTTIQMAISFISTYNDLLSDLEANEGMLIGQIFDEIEIINQLSSKTMINNFSYKQARIELPKPNLILFSNNHFECIKSGKNFLINNSGDLCNFKGRKIVKRFDLLKNKNIKIWKCGSEQEKTPVKYSIVIVDFDFETKWNASKKGMVEAISVQYKMLYNIEQEDEKPIKVNMMNILFGEDCVDKFIKDCMQNQEDCLFVFNGYNSSRFDNFLLLEPLAKNDLLQSVFFQGNSILSMQIGGRHTVFDTCRFTMGKLADVAKSWQLKAQKKELNANIDFNKIQQTYNNGQTINDLLHSEDCLIKNHDLLFNVHYDYDESKRLVRKLIQKQRNDEQKLRDEADIKWEQISFGINDQVKLELLYKEYMKDKSSIYLDKHKADEDLEYQYIQIIDPKKTEENMFDCIECQCQNFRDFCSYGLYDIMALDELYIKLRIIMDDINAYSGKQLFDFKTIGSTIYQLFEHNVKQDQIELALLDLDDYKKTKSGLCAGRTQSYMGVYVDLSGKKRYYMLDVKSLYPYVMLCRMYGCGKQIKGSYEECIEKEKIGFYEVTFNQKNLKKNILPLRVCGKSLDWNYKGEMTCFINTVDIADLILHGCEIVHIGEGFYFENKISGKQLFRCQKYFKNIKQEQDKYKIIIDSKIANEIEYKEAVENYNPALREMAKLFLNSLSGKVIENLHFDQYLYVKTQSQLKQVALKSIGNPDVACCIDGQKSIVHYKIDEEEALKQNNRPIYIGCLIYSYARSHMYNQILSDYDVIYQDTDSALITEEEYQKFIKNDEIRIKSGQRSLIGSKFGQFELEKGSGQINKVVILAPKNYFLFIDDKCIKQGFKGVNIKSDKIENCDKYITKDQLLGLKFKFGKDGEVKKDKYIEDDKYILKLYDMWNLFKKQTLKDPAILREFIDRQVKGEPCYMLCSSLQKVIKNIGNKVGGNMYQRFMIKKIQLKV